MASRRVRLLNYWDEFAKIGYAAFNTAFGEKIPVRTVAVDFADFVSSKEEGDEI